VIARRKEAKGNSTEVKSSVHLNLHECLALVKIFCMCFMDLALILLHYHLLIFIVSIIKTLFKVLESF